MHDDRGGPRGSDKGTWVTGPTQTLTFAGTGNQTTQGVGRADRILITINAAIATTTGITTIISTEGSGGSVLTVLTGFVRAAVLKYEDYGDAIRQPLNFANVTTALTVFVTPVFWRDGKDDN